MSNQNWKLHSKKDVIARTGKECGECKKPILAGSFQRVMTYKNDENEYKKKCICEECERYYRRNS